MGRFPTLKMEELLETILLEVLGSEGEDDLGNDGSRSSSS